MEAFDALRSQASANSPAEQGPSLKRNKRLKRAGSARPRKSFACVDIVGSFFVGRLIPRSYAQGCIATAFAPLSNHASYRGTRARSVRRRQRSGGFDLGRACALGSFGNSRRCRGRLHRHRTCGRTSRCPIRRRQRLCVSTRGREHQHDDRSKAHTTTTPSSLTTKWRAVFTHHNPSLEAHGMAEVAKITAHCAMV